MNTNLKSKTFFDGKLYVEGLRQLRLSGGIVGAIIFAISILFPIVAMVIYRSNIGVPPQPVSLVATAPMLILFMYLGPIVFTMVLFAFLNKRSGSDFYGSLPNTRTSIFVSFFASVATYLIGIIVITVLATSLLWMISPLFFNLQNIPYVLGTFVCGTLLMAAACLIALSVSGTAFTNLSLIVLIAFLPRLIITVFIGTVQGATGIMPAEAFGILRPDYNIPFGLFASALPQLSRGTEAMFSSLGSMGYSLALAILYLVIAGFLFKKRRSEAAEKSTVHPILQHIVRCAISIPISLIFTVVFVLAKDINSGVITTFLIVWTVTTLIYFIFELISTRKVRNLVKAIPVYFLVMAFNAVFGFSILGVNAMVESYRPSANDIAGIQIIKADDPYQEPAYHDLAVSKIVYKDEEIRKLLAESIRPWPDRWASAGEAMQTVRIKISPKLGFAKYRYVYLNESQSTKLNTLMTKNEEYVKIISQLPPDNSIKLYQCMNLSQEAAKQLYGVFKEEFAGLSALEKTQILGFSNNISNPYSKAQMTLNLIGNVGVKSFAQSIAISEELPKTYQKAVELVNEQSIPVAKELISQIEKNQLSSYNVSLIYEAEDEEGIAMPGYLFLYYDKLSQKDEIGMPFSQEEQETLISLFKAALARPVDMKTKLCQLSIGTYNQEDSTSRNADCYLSFTDDEMKQIVELAKKQNEKTEYPKG